MKFLFLIAPVLLVFSCRKPAESHAPVQLSPRVVQLIPAALVPHTATEEIVGTVRAKHRAAVAAKLSGRILEYRGEPGTLVKRGDSLAKIDADEIQARATQARALLDQAHRDFARQTQLLARNATPRQEYESAEARVKVAEAALVEAETMLGYADVTAPFDGVVIRKLADLGDLAMPGKPLLEIEDPEALRFEADIPEALVHRIHAGDILPVRVATTVEGKVSEISPIADPVSRTFLVKLDLPTEAGLRSGQFGRVAVPIAETQILLIPRTALEKRGQMEIVFVVHQGIAHLRLVKSGRLIGDRVEILSGLAAGEQLVAAAPYPADGQPVTPASR